MFKWVLFQLTSLKVIKLPLSVTLSEGEHSKGLTAFKSRLKTSVLINLSLLTIAWLFVIFSHSLSICRRSCSYISLTVWRCCAGNNNNNFIIALTNVSPNVSRPTLWNYTVCGQYPGAPPDGATVTMYCPENIQPFRYVVVQLPSTNQRMRLCELQVFEKSTWMIFKFNARSII